MKQLPVEFVARMKRLMSEEEFRLYEDSYQQDAVRAFRVNTEKISLEEFEKINIFGNEKIPYVENGFYLDYEKAGNHPYHHAGMIYVQEPGAMHLRNVLKSALIGLFLICVLPPVAKAVS